MKAISIFFLTIGIVAILFFPLQKASTDSYDSFGLRILGFFSSDSKPSANIFGTTGDLVEFTIQKNAVISGVTQASGLLKGGYFFEGNARGMLLDGNKQVQKTFSITATGDWMTTDAVPFDMTIDASGMLPGSGYIRIANDNPSGDSSKDKYVDIPVVFQ
jgi:hypothetical protein